MVGCLITVMKWFSQSTVKDFCSVLSCNQIGASEAQIRASDAGRSGFQQNDCSSQGASPSLHIRLECVPADQSRDCREQNRRHFAATKN